jgi:phosphate transport system permease protein
MSTPGLAVPGAFVPQPPAGGQGPTATTRLSDRVLVALCWLAGLMLVAITGAILIFMLVKGVSYLSVNLLFSHPSPSVSQSGSGGILDPLEGTLLLTAIGIVIAVPLGVATAVWLTEFGRPFWLARAVDSGVEIVAGTPSIVLAFFGFTLFTRSPFGFLSVTASGNAIFGRSFLCAGLMMSLIALPLVVSTVREGLSRVPAHVREASYALGKGKWATIRRILIPQVRPAIGTGTALGMGRIIGDTAIVVILLGATDRIDQISHTPVLGLLRGTGSTLTSYVYNNSPAGEGNAPQKAYATAFVLLVLVIVINLIVERLSSRGAKWNN